MTQEKGNNTNQVKMPRKTLYAFAIILGGVLVWVNFGSFTQYGLQIKLAESSIPTLINGITASASLVIGIFIAVLGIMIRLSIERKDTKSKQFYLRGMVALMVPVFWLWTTYVFLTTGFTQFAVQYALSALITALFFCILVVLYMVVRITNQTDREDPTIGDDM